MIQIKGAASETSICVGKSSEEAARQAEAIMTTPVIAVDPSASVADAAALMLANKISGQRDQTG
ncbi:hypothetical protein X742_07920 [Mesorhizobium sp. LNHC232B00]|nr:hypothetical protein X742_07920 [Mesorhizobium sp. LNHC232B00]